MGTSKRYAARVAHELDDRIAQSIAMDRTAETLTEQEIELARVPLTQPPIAIPVMAWVRFAGVPLLVEAEAVAWTSRAVAIRWRIPHDDREHRAWVWAGAVSGID